MISECLVDMPSLEAYTCNEALALAKDLNTSHVIIASDCMQVISDINQDAQSSYSMVLDEIKDRMKDFVKVIFRFKNRDANYESHAWAKAASLLPVGRHMWLGIPQTLFVFRMF